MGPFVDIRRVQSWSTRLLRDLFCSMAHHDGKATQIRHSVSLVVSLLMVFIILLARIMLCHFETTHPLGKMARCRYPSNLMHNPLGRIPYLRHDDITTKLAGVQGSISCTFVL
jgi:hypothetical protein